MSWTDVFPIFSEQEREEFSQYATAEDHQLLEEWFGVERIVNQQVAMHIVSASLFWKNVSNEEAELPTPSRENMLNAVALGLVNRYAPWEHYVLPLLEGAADLKQQRPDVVFRVYLAADLAFLIEDLVEAGCEVFLMKSSSLRHNPGAMWRFLAFEEKDKWITITDSDRAREVIHDVERTELIMESGLGLWRVPYVFDSLKHDHDPSFYRPIIACYFGGKSGLAMTELMKAFLWHTLRGTIENRCSMAGEKGPLIFGTQWPSYGFDEWFLLAVLYPRMAFEGVLTFISWNEHVINHWYALDIEYVTWANHKSEILYFGESPLIEKFRIMRSHSPSNSKIYYELLQEKSRESATKSTLPASPSVDKITLVVARYAESIEWLTLIPDHVEIILYNKGAKIISNPVKKRVKQIVEIPNVGREADTYLYHLEHHVHGADNEWTVFCQGDPFSHSPHFLELLKISSQWKDIQCLTPGYMERFDTPPQSVRMLENTEWLGEIELRTELSSTGTLDMFGWVDNGGRVIMNNYFMHHHLPKGWNITGHFLEQCGLLEYAKQAWSASLVQFAFGAIFAVRNYKLEKIPKKCLPQMRELAQGHYSHGYIYERLWLHLFGLPFIQVNRNSITIS